MKNTLKKILQLNIFILLFIWFLQGCQERNKCNIKIISQELIYDSLNNKEKIFKVNLYTKLVFRKRKVLKKEISEYSILINNITYKLNPDLNKDFYENYKGQIVIDYTSKINLSSKIFKNDSLKNIIINKSKILNSKGEIINKDSDYKFNSLITIRPIEKKDKVLM